jgi:mono/diheme cytochrome c family protein
MRAAATAIAFAVLAGSAAAQDISHSQIERGRYLAAASNCVSCHTDTERDGLPFAGGREMETPFGVIVTPNITFDAGSGIGAWTRQDFRRALHEGVRRDGAQLYPAMPYPYFTRMPDEDVDAIYEYLRTIPTVQAEHQPEAGLPWPLRFRESVRGWKLFNFEEGRFEPDPEKSEAWNRGAYLVNGPGHCGACHTDKNVTGGDRESEYLRGGVLEDWFAPNIRGGAGGGIEHWSEDDIVEFMGTGRAAHTIAMSRMGEVVAFSTQHLTEDDLGAIATYLKDLDDEASDGGGRPDDAVMAAGEAIYFDNCAACHRADGEGVDYIFARLAGSNKVNADDATTMLRVILEGARAMPTEARPTPFAMPAFSWKLSDREIADLASYVRNAFGNDASPVSAGDVANLREALFD